MIGTTTPIGANWYANQALNGELSVRQKTTLGKFDYQLIDGRPDVVGELDLYNRFCANGSHTRCRPDNIGFLYRRVEDPVIAVFLRERRGLTKDAPQPAAYILTIKKCFLMFAENIVYSMKGCIYHDDLFSSFRGAVTPFFGDRRFGKLVADKIVGVRLGSGYCALEITFDFFDRLHFYLL